MSDIGSPNRCASTFTDIVFLLFPTLESLTRGQGRATGNNTGTQTRLPLERREQRSHSGYDNCLLNDIKPQCCPHAAGMSPLTKRHFIALPSPCPGDTGGTKAAVTPRGIGWTHLLDVHCERDITSLSDVTRHCVAVFLCLGTKHEGEKKEQFGFLLWNAQLAPFYSAGGGLHCWTAAIVVILEKATF